MLVQEVGEALGLLDAIVDLIQQQVLHVDAATRRGAIALERLHQLGNRIALVDGHQLGAQHVVGRVQRDRELHLHRLLDQCIDARQPPGRRDRDRARAKTEAVGVVGEVAEAEHVVEVLQRLAHAHHHDVADARIALACGAGRPQELLVDLALRERAAEAHRARRAKRALERAARLRREAHRVAILAAHQHGLGGKAIARREPRLDGAVLRALLLFKHQLVDRRALLERSAQRLRKRRGLIPRVDEVATDGLADLIGAVVRCALLGEDGKRGVEIHARTLPVAASRRRRCRCP